MTGIDGVLPGDSLLYRRSHRAQQLAALVDRLVERYELCAFHQPGEVGRMVRAYRLRLLRVIEMVSRRVP